MVNERVEQMKRQQFISLDSQFIYIPLASFIGPFIYTMIMSNVNYQRNILYTTWSFQF